MTELHLVQSIARLKRRLEVLRAWDPTSVKERFKSATLDGISAAIDDSLTQTFGAGTVEYNRYHPATYFDQGPIRIGGGDNIPISEVHRRLAQSKADNIALLEQAVEGLEERLADLKEAATTAAGHSTKPVVPAPSNRIFIVHGHDKEALAEVARLLTQLGLVPIILHEQPNKGRTIIEKFEEEGKVGFAIVLLTPDDLGKAKDDSALGRRARQNVILELGYFVGSVGRSRVCALVRGDLELPSDIAGVVYERFDDAGAWKYKLARELRDAGYDLDMNKV